MPSERQHHVTTAWCLCLLIGANCIHASIIEEKAQLDDGPLSTAAVLSTPAAQGGHKCAGGSDSRRLGALFHLGTAPSTADIGFGSYSGADAPCAQR